MATGGSKSPSDPSSLDAIADPSELAFEYFKSSIINDQSLSSEFKEVLARDLSADAAALSGVQAWAQDTLRGNAPVKTSRE